MRQEPLQPHAHIAIHIVEFAAPLRPWLSMIQPQPDLEGDSPTIKMDINWNLVFGGG